MNNPFLEGFGDSFEADFDLGAKKETVATPEVPWETPGPLITEAGCYPDIPISRYHGVEICPSPSISPTGAKLLTGRGTKGCTPRHFWEQSNLNPNRRPHVDTDALRFGRALHDAVLLSDRWQKDGYYHVLPEGFSRAKTKAMAIEIEAADEAIAAGMDVVSAEDAILINAMVAEIRKNKFANLLLSNGHPEVTLAAPDPETGIWRRTRPDFLPDKKMVLLDLKTTADASREGFSRSIKEYRYDLAAAMQMDMVDQLYGPDPARQFVHLCVEKPAKWNGQYIPVALWTLPAEDIQRGAFLYRRAMRTFAGCLKSGVWESYADEPRPCGLPSYEAKQIDDGTFWAGDGYQQRSEA